MIENEVLTRLPKHLRQYIKPQCYEQYTAIDQAVWRYVMRKNIHFLSKYAHPSYCQGLKITGIEQNRIPNLYGMNRILKEIGWAAVAVDGFIPPRAFMEFQAYNVLVIASDIRHRSQIEYTPAPDIIHESAGHAPMLANAEYAAFLRRFGEIGAKAISSPFNLKMYNSIRKLSQLKEEKIQNKAAILEAEQKIQDLQHHVVVPSEMDCLRNLHWWSVEYGIIGNPTAFKLFGAGLLSSIGESQWCLSDQVKKLPFTLEVIHQKFDITQPQPQLFVTPDFTHLSKVLEELANTMGLRRGGKTGVEKLIASEELGTVELSTGLQISGKFNRLLPHPKDSTKLAYIQTDGPTALAFRNQEIVGQGTENHPGGFGFPVGKLKGSNLAIEDMTPYDLEVYGIVEGNTIALTFDSGLAVKGKIITGVRNLFGKIMLISFTECTVLYQDEVLFAPQWGPYDMAIGKSITSAYAGPADMQYFPFEKHRLTQKKIDPTVDKSEKLYQRLEDCLHDSKNLDQEIDTLGPKVLSVKAKDWLLVLNFYVLSRKAKYPSWEKKALKQLKKFKMENPNLVSLIDDGLELFTNEQ